jgi:hypothetical protein
MIRNTCLLAAVAILSGCATSAIAPQDAKAAPADRILITSNPGGVKVTFVRDTGFVGSGVYQHIYIDGREAAQLNPGEKAEFLLAPGEHIFGVQPTDPFDLADLLTIDQDLKIGQAYYYRALTSNGDMTLQRFIPQAQ